MNRREAVRRIGAHAMLPLAVRGMATGAWNAVTALPAATDLDLTLTAQPAEAAILPGPATRVWRYSARVSRGPDVAVTDIPDSYLGPVLRVRRGDRVRVHFENRLDEPSIVHWHGLDVPERADGHPRLAVEAGQSYDYEFEVANRAGTYWYHPHPHMRTAAQAYRGMAGLLIVHDDEEDALKLPSGDAELPCVLQDRRFDAGNQLIYPDDARGMQAMMQTMNGWLGDVALVNGRRLPSTPVARGTVRVRFLNGSNARIYKLAWSDGSPITVIGSDGGLLERARTMTSLTLAPGQRADTLLDLSAHVAGSTVRLRSLAFPADAVGQVGMMGGAAPVPQGAPLDLMTLQVTSARGRRVELPARLSTPPAAWTPQPGAPVRTIPLAFMRMQWLIGGRTFAMEEVAPDETVKAGSTHVWELRNEPNPMGMALAHPIHVHGTQFRVLSRAGADRNPLRDGLVDSDANDTVLVLPGETVRVQLTFSRHTGLFLYHCHILEHEDMGMMRNFRIVPAGG